MKYGIILINLLFVLSSCSLIEKDPNINYDSGTPEGLYNLSRYYADQNRYEEAITQLNNLRKKFPYSQYSLQGELRVADLQFEREFFLEAESAYKSFYELHPTHEKSDYVLFRLGESYFNQLPSTIDRDLKLAQSAIFYYQKVIADFPKSPFLPKAQEQMTKAKAMLAEKEESIGNFYFIRDKFLSAFLRYQSIVDRFILPSDQRLKALYRTTVSAYRAEKHNEARKYFLILEKEFPQSSETQLARKELTNGP